MTEGVPARLQRAQRQLRAALPRQLPAAVRALKANHVESSQPPQVASRSDRACDGGDREVSTGADINCMSEGASERTSRAKPLLARLLSIRYGVK
jgi:hypothetical protein